MAINKNHEFEELDGKKCAIVEKNASAKRVAFLKELLELNKYTVVVVASPPPKPAVPPLLNPRKLQKQVLNQLPNRNLRHLRETFTIGVTDVTFNPTNAHLWKITPYKRWPCSYSCVLE